MNQPPDYCPYCGSPVDPVESLHTADVVETPMIYRCETCDDYVFYNPCPGGSAIVLDGDRMLLVQDFREPHGWKLPSGRVELGESMRQGVARELEEETGLAVDPADLVYAHDEASEPRAGQHMVNVEYAVRRADTAGDLAAASDAIDAAFFTPSEFAASEHELTDVHVDRFGEDSLPWLYDVGAAALERADR